MERWERPVLCIVGPTATGKSELGVWLAKQLGSEVISADSMQVYRGMDVGTAKLSSEEMQGVPHHLIDIVDPLDRFTVAEWKARAETVIDRLHARGVLPLVVGGTGLYIRSITDDLDFAGAEGSAAIRDKWRRFAEAHGAAALHAELAARDPETARRLHPNDVRRVIRALEVIELGQSPWSDRYAWRLRGGRYQTLQIGLTMPRKALYARVDQRVDLMLERGLVEEVRRLLEQGVERSCTSMQAIGYKEIAAYLNGELGYEEAIARVKQATRRFVKRQLSWFRRDPRIVWIEKDASGCWPDGALDAILRAARRLAAGIPVHSLE
jgi:tRNA dimethylallyltransferase